MAFPINPPNAKLVNDQGICSPEWYRFFLNIQKLIGTSQANPFDDSALIATIPSAPPADSMADAMLASVPSAPAPAGDPLVPPAMPFPSLDDAFLMTPYRLPPGA